MDVAFMLSRSIPEPNSGCWLWLGPYSHHGYGKFKKDGQRYAAHRASWSAVNGDIPAGLFILHKCDNPTCINPDHLYAGTHADNTADAIKRDRFHRWSGARAGERNPRSRLTAKQVRSIRADPRGYRTLARAYGVGKSTIRDIKKGLIWATLKP